MQPMSRIKLRAANNMFEVSLVSVNEEQKTIDVLWDEGETRTFAWSAIIWGESGKEIYHKPSAPATPSMCL